MASYQELLAQREQLERQINEVMARERAQGIAQVMEIIEQYELTEADLFNRKPSNKNAGGKVAPKYRNPITGETWTGRGKTPKWLEGVDHHQYLITDKVEEQTPASWSYPVDHTPVDPIPTSPAAIDSAPINPSPTEPAPESPPTSSWNFYS